MFDKKSNIAAQEAFGEAVNTGNFDAFDDLVATDSVDNDPAPGQGPGPDGYKAFFGEMRTAFPDLNVEVQISRFADGKMVERWGSTDELGIARQLGLA